jgi:hypothetical protein
MSVCLVRILSYCLFIHFHLCIDFHGGNSVFYFIYSFVVFCLGVDTKL